MTLTGEAAQKRLQEAVKYFRKAKRPLLAFELLQAHPQLAQALPAEVPLHSPLALLSRAVKLYTQLISVLRSCVLVGTYWLIMSSFALCMFALLKPCKAIGRQHGAHDHGDMSAL